MQSLEVISNIIELAGSGFAFRTFPRKACFKPNSSI